ncbi:hypothetical protein ACMFMG_002324 [Clarireedia jacksonii]
MCIGDVRLCRDCQKKSYKIKDRCDRWRLRETENHSIHGYRIWYRCQDCIRIRSRRARRREARQVRSYENLKATLEWKNGMRPLALTDGQLLERKSLENQIQRFREKLPLLQNTSHRGPCDGWSRDAAAAIRVVEAQPGQFEEALRRQSEIDFSKRKLTDEDLNFYFNRYSIDDDMAAAMAIIRWNEDFPEAPNRDLDIKTFREWLPFNKWVDYTVNERCDVVLYREFRNYLKYLIGSGADARARHARNVLHFHSWEDQRTYEFREEAGKTPFMSLSRWSKIAYCNGMEEEDYERWYELLDSYRDYLMYLGDSVLKRFDKERSEIAHAFYMSLIPDNKPGRKERFQWEPFKEW